VIGEDDGIREEALGNCAHSGCDATFKDHHWGHIEAGNKGWFFQKNGDRWCPRHVPDWVEGWRAQRSGSVPSTAPVGRFEPKPD
jgi:hypothetical protein